MIQVLPSGLQTTTADAQLSFTFTHAGPTVCGGCGAKLTCGCGCEAQLPHRCPSVHGAGSPYVAPLRPWWVQPQPVMEPFRWVPNEGPVWQIFPNQTICSSDISNNVATC